MALEGVGPSSARAIQGENGNNADFASAAISKPPAIKPVCKLAAELLLKISFH